MNLVNFIIWLSAGAVVGWFASRMVKAQTKQVPKINVIENPQTRRGKKENKWVVKV